MAKDPAALLYIDTWLSSTAEMDADCRGWYINLLLHQYDKGSLPDDIEKLASLAVVRFSEFERFKQVFEQVLKQKFGKCEDGRLRNEKADEIIRGREKFTKKRSKSGSIGYVIKKAMSIGFKDSEIDKLKSELYNGSIDIEEAKSEQVLKQVLKLYRNGDEDGDITKDDFNKGVHFQNEELNDVFNRWLKMLDERKKPMTQSSIEALCMRLNRQSDELSIKQITQSLEKGWLTLRSVENDSSGKQDYDFKNFEGVEYP